MSVRIVVVVMLATGVLTTSPALSQDNKTEELMAKSAAYVAQFVDQFSNVVAEETLVQETTIPRRKRTMRSDFLLVRYPGDAQWQSFRDVAEVDGKPVRDKEERLTKLFLEPASSAVRRARELQEAGTRYNLLDIGSLNNPLMAIAFLQNEYRERFQVQSRRPRQEARSHSQAGAVSGVQSANAHQGEWQPGHSVARPGVDRRRHRTRREDRAADWWPRVADLNHHRVQIRRGTRH